MKEIKVKELKIKQKLTDQGKIIKSIIKTTINLTFYKKEYF